MMLADLAAALQLGDGEAEPEEPIAGILCRYQAAAVALIDERATGAPNEVKDEAVILLCGYWYDMDPSAQGDRQMAAWRYSGAASLLAPWAIRRTGISEGS